MLDESEVTENQFKTNLAEVVLHREEGLLAVLPVPVTAFFKNYYFAPLEVLGTELLLRFV